jgi:cation transport regulator ChaB
MGGVIADFASTGGAALANVLMKEFAKNLVEDLIKDDADPARADTKALSAHKLIWSAVKTKFSQRDATAPRSASSKSHVKPTPRRICDGNAPAASHRPPPGRAPHSRHRSSARSRNSAGG